MAGKIFIFFLWCVCSLSFSQSYEQDSARQRPKVGLVLSGGGAKGFAYVGLLKVFHEVGLPIDYVGGSSIGAIVGGLYAMGYHPDSIAKMIRHEDWRKVISNKLDRKYVSYEEKLFNEKNILTIPLKNNKLKMASSLYGSLHVDLMLNRYFAKDSVLTDFNHLQIPFLCIGTNLISGDPIVLRNGNLPRAIRSSMAIPGYFSSVYYQGNYLIDGGVVNNYPAKEVKEMGAEIIIGGDVQEKDPTGIDELSTILDLFNHILSYSKNRANAIGMENTDLHIRYKIDYGMLDFTQHDSIMAIGERISRLYYDDLKSLADSLNEIEFKAVGDFVTKPLDSISIHQVRVKIEEGIFDEQFVDFMEENKNKRIGIKKLEEDIKYIYGTGNYGDVYHEFVKKNDKVDLVVHASDPKNGHVGAGLHYDSDYKANLLLNLTLRNQTAKRAKIFTDLVIGQSPRLRSLYVINNARKPGFGLEADIFSYELSEYRNKERVNKWFFDNLTVGTFIPFEVNNNFMVKAGVQYNAFRYRQDLEIDTTYMGDDHIYSYLNGYVSFHRDTRDDLNFPTRGSNVIIKGKYIFPFDEGGYGDAGLMASVQSDYNISMSSQLVFSPGFFVGLTLHDKSPPIQHLFGTGGLNQENYMDNIQSFAGLRFVERFGSYAAIVRAKLRYNFHSKLYLSALTDVGFNEMSIEDFSTANLMVGYGLKMSYNSFVGPIGFSVTGSNQVKGPMVFLNMGLWF